MAEPNGSKLAAWAQVLLAILAIFGVVAHLATWKASIDERDRSWKMYLDSKFEALDTRLKRLEDKVYGD